MAQESGFRCLHPGGAAAVRWEREPLAEPRSPAGSEHREATPRGIFAGDLYKPVESSGEGGKEGGREVEDTWESAKPVLERESLALEVRNYLAKVIIGKISLQASVSIGLVFFFSFPLPHPAPLFLGTAQVLISFRQLKSSEFPSLIQKASNQSCFCSGDVEAIIGWAYVTEKQERIWSFVLFHAFH